MFPVPVLANKIVEQGLENVNVSMLPDHLKNKVLTAAGLLFLKKGEINNCIKALTLSKNFSKLEEIGESYLLKQNIELSCLFFIASNNTEKIESIAKICMQKGKTKLAYMAYKHINNNKMCSFIKENFL